MGTVGSSILSASGSTINDIQNQNLSTSNYEYRNEPMPVIVDVMSIDSDSSKFKKNHRVPRTSPVVYGPICIKKRRSAAPTLATGRRSKDAIMEGDEARKREIRRMKNRISARNLKRLRDNIENDLKSQVKELETKQKDLLIQIEHLHKYKQDLEEKYQQSNSLYEFIARTASTTLIEVEENQQQKLPPIHYYRMESKEEQNPPSPQWQLLFSI